MKTIAELSEEYTLTLRPIIVNRGQQIGWGRRETSGGSE
jgi:hypothetical protein